jgi:hypothetical protein
VDGEERGHDREAARHHNGARVATARSLREERNSGRGQVCEIDHLVALELGGSDTMANLWPECSAGYNGWQGPGFRDKDGFENYLWYHVCVDRDVSLEEAQRQIATDWRKYWEIAGKPECRSRSNCK